MTAETYSSRQATNTEQADKDWWPLDCLRPLGRAASIASGASWSWRGEYRGFRIQAAGQDGAYAAQITHGDGQPLRLPPHIRHQVEQANFKSPEEAMQHARFVITSGALNPFLAR